MKTIICGIYIILDILIHYSPHASEFSPAIIIEPPLHTTTQAGFFIFIICKAQGNPKPVVQFRINGNVQKTEGHRKIIRTFDYGASLRQQVQMDNNNDKIECTAENHLGVDTKSATITVIDSNGEAPPGFPTIDLGPVDVLGQIGKSAEIRCQVKSDPRATVTWIKDSHYQVDLDNERYGLIGSGSLHIKHVKEKDNGNYECMARNKVGTVISQAGGLRIRNSPMTPQIIDFKSQIEVSVGSGANLTCNAEGYPIPQVWWAVQIGTQNNHNSEQRPLSERKPSSSTIHITDITESGVYTCFATNNMGTVRKMVNVIVKKKPNVPTDLTQILVGATFTILEWTPVKSNPSVDSYTLVIKDTKNKNPHLGVRQTANIFPSSLTYSKESGKVSFNATDLKPFTNYEARVVAVNNKIGSSDASLPAYFQTKELPPSSAPTDISAVTTGVDSIEIKWKAPLETNGRIQGYKVYHTEKMSQPIGSWFVYRTTETKHNIFHLIPNATYYVKVNAFNNEGDGPVSDAFAILMVPGVPPVPQNFRGAALSAFSIQIMWSAPAMPQGMVLENYELKYKPDKDDKAPVNKESISADKTQYLIENLKAGTTYYISLAGKTAYGVGVAAQINEKTKDEDDISDMMDIEIWGKNLSKVSAMVCWKLNWTNKPNYNLHEIEYMMMFDQLESKPTAENATNVFENVKCCCRILENLRPAKGYDIWVKPMPTTSDNQLNINLINLISKKLTIITMPRKTVPGVPDGISLKVLGPTSIKVTWKGPNNMLDQVKHYVIHWVSRPDDPKQNSHSEEGSIKVDVDNKTQNNSFEYVLNTLTSNLLYKVEVKAVSGEGEGKAYTFPYVRTEGESKVPSLPRDFIISQSTIIQINKDVIFLALHLTWNPPEQIHGKIMGYRVGITLVGPSEIVEELRPKKIYHNVTAQSYITTKDDEIGYGKSYLFEVQALNEINFGFPAKLNQAMPESKPTAPPSKLEIQAYKNAVTLKWEPPPINMRNGLITGYKIQYYDIKDEKSMKKEVKIESQTSTQITDLSEKTNYVFMIRACTNEGDGPWSPGSSYYISSEFFPPPDNIRVRALNEHQVKVIWDFPFKSNFIVDLQSQITGFHIQLSKNKEFSDDDVKNKKIIGPFTTAVIDKAYSNQYFVRMKSIIRDDRSSAWSSLETVSVLKSKNDDRNLRSLFCSGQSRAIKVMWSRPEEYSEISFFRVKVTGVCRYRGLDDTTKTQSITPRAATVEFKPNEQYSFSYLLDSLDPNTNYDVTVNIEYNPTSKMEGLSKTTSCATLMAKPQKVLVPKPIPQRKISNNVVLQLNRVEEKFGRISHYYLVVGPIKETFITANDVDINKTLANTLKMKTIQSLFVAAQFTSALFQSKPFTEYTLGSEIPNPAFKEKDWIYFRNLPMKKNQKYKAFLRACILLEGAENPSSDQLCSSSRWSTEFSPEINREAEVFTIAVIAGIGSIIFLVFVCIGFACFLKRSHSKVSRPLNSNDPCLKQPLMMQPGLSGGTLPRYTNVISTGNSSRHGYSDSLRTNSDLCNSNGIVTPITNHQPLSVSNPMFEQRSLELKKMPNTPAPDLVQNTLSISNSARPPIPVHRLESQINELRANDNFLFSQEYESIDPGQQFTWEHSNLEINRSKNRYANVIAYDHSRILLQSIDSVFGSDYINANYIDGYKRANAYIATQGPLSNTFGDFWRMVWEQGTAAIVMMTKLEERTRIKCDQYWPNKGTESYADGAINVTIMDTKELAYYTIRTFMISANYSSKSSEFCSNKEKREIRQYQFTAWPDHGVPDNPMPLLMFLKRIRAGNPPNSGPIIVHCSAGVGRTGAFIVIDATIERIRHEMTVDIFGQVSIMRAQRNYMVQTEDQYVFVHEVVLDAVRASNTEVSLQNIPSHVQKLMRADCSSGTQRATGIELEFQKLSQFKPNNARCTSANLPVNRLKNRLVNILPYEFNRICLQPIRGCEGSDYINASYIDGYQNIKAYIATQAPLLETVEDFWRMIWEHNSTIIVMLTKLREMGREKCHRYWPTERSSRFQYFVVDPMVEYNMPNFVLQEFKVTDARDGQSRTVRQFQFTEWPEQGIPYQATEAFIDFIGQVHKTKEQFGQEGPITVHCSAGVGRTGAFLALSIALERLKNEGILDLFQIVRSLRYQRANMVQSEEQYRFCYLAAQDYVNSFDNFFE